MKAPTYSAASADLAFSHSRDAIAAVTGAGGFGVQGSSTVSFRQLSINLSPSWENGPLDAQLPVRHLGALGRAGLPADPLPGILDSEVKARVVRAQRGDHYAFPVGQSAGAVSSDTSVADVMYGLQAQYG